MSNETPTESATGTPRVSFERLRERTDELELIISGLTTVTLFSLPGWLLDHLAPLYPKLPLAFVVAVNNGMLWLIGLCYLLGTFFALHLGVRAYWVGLIGLKSVFPQGIRWDKATSYGPIARVDLQRRLPDIDSAIAGADRLASMLFALITLGALTAFWIALLIVGVLGSVATVGISIGLPVGTMNAIILSLIGLIIGTAVAVWLLDAVLAARWPALAESARMRATVLGLRRVVKLTFPERLLAPVQLTLQTNTHPRLFLLAFFTAITLVPFLGLHQWRSFFRFDVYDTHVRVNDAHLNNSRALHSRYYEDSLKPRDLRRLGPLIPSQRINSTWFPLFLPYWPLLDDPHLEKLCGPEFGSDAADCLRRIWRVELNGKPVALDGFFIAERGDLGFRGLQGYLSLEAARPGPQHLRIVWNPAADPDSGEDSPFPTRLEHSIPFLLAPDWGTDAPQSGD